MGGVAESTSFQPHWAGGDGHSQPLEHSASREEEVVVVGHATRARSKACGIRTACERWRGAATVSQIELAVSQIELTCAIQQPCLVPCLAISSLLYSHPYTASTLRKRHVAINNRLNPPPPHGLASRTWAGHAFILMCPPSLFPTFPTYLGVPQFQRVRFSATRSPSICQSRAHRMPGSRSWS